MLTHYERGEMSISLGVEIFIGISGKYHTKKLISSKKKTKKQQQQKRPKNKHLICFLMLL